MTSKLTNSIVYNLASNTFINQIAETDLNTIRKTFRDTLIITFDYDIWSTVTNAKYVHTGKNIAVMQAVRELGGIIYDHYNELNNHSVTSFLRNTNHFVFGTGLNEEFEAIIEECIQESHEYMSFDSIIDIAKKSKHYSEKLDYNLEIVVPSHVTFCYFVKMFKDIFASKPIYRLLHDSVEIPMNFLNGYSKQIYLVDSHVQKITKWGKSTEYFPIIHFSSEHNAQKLIQYYDYKKHDFVFGMSNYTGSEDTERSLIERTMHSITNVSEKIKFYVSGNVYPVRTKIPYEQYLEEVAKSASTMIIPSYDANAVSVRRISESILSGTVLLFWSKDDLYKLFDNDMYRGFLNIYEDFDIIIDNHDPDTLLAVIRNASNYRAEIIEELQETKIFSEWFNLSWYKQRMSDIISANDKTY